MSIKADCFISIIGTNPLPGFYTSLKYCDMNTYVKLVFTKATENSIGSERLAKNLKCVIGEKIPGIKIDLVECDKSDIKKIQACINKIIKDFTYSDESKNIILDYTSGTKAMSAIFVNRFLNIKNDIDTVKVAYLNDEDEKIYEYSRNDEEMAYPIKDILNDYDISVQNITNIYGYNLKSVDTIENILNGKVNRIIKPCFSSLKGWQMYVDEVYFLNGTLILCFKSNYTYAHKSRYKIELFKFKDIADKLGGSRSHVLYQSDCDEELIRKLKIDITTDYEHILLNRFNFIDFSKTFEDEIIKKYEIEGGI